MAPASPEPGEERQAAVEAELREAIRRKLEPRDERAGARAATSAR